MGVDGVPALVLQLSETVMLYQHLLPARPARSPKPISTNLPSKVKRLQALESHQAGKVPTKAEAAVGADMRPGTFSAWSLGCPGVRAFCRRKNCIVAM